MFGSRGPMHVYLECILMVLFIGDAFAGILQFIFHSLDSPFEFRHPSPKISHNAGQTAAEKHEDDYTND